MEDDDTREIPIHQTQQLPRTIAVRQTRRILIAILGGLLLGFGVVGLLLPVLPGWILIIAGLTVLSWEFDWARKLLDQARARLRRMRRTSK